MVVKVGSALLVDGESGRINRSLAGDPGGGPPAPARARAESHLGVIRGDCPGPPPPGPKAGALRLEDSQAAAAVGQIRLAHAYKELLEEKDVTVAQVLLTLEDSERRRRYLNARATLESLLELGALPVINENDTVATAEIRYGDNDRLAARVAQMTSADCLVLLSDVDGLYSADPGQDPGARFIREVRHITPEIEAMAGRATSQVGTGGMARQDPRRAHRGLRRLPHVHRRRRTTPIRCDASRRGRGAPGSCPPHPGGGAQAVDRRHPAPGGGADDRRGRAAGVLERRASCRPASPARAGASTAATL